MINIKMNGDKVLENTYKIDNTFLFNDTFNTF